MHFKTSPIALMIYSNMLLYVCILILSLLKCLRLKKLLEVFAFISALMIFASRWVTVGYLPMQNMFEIFIALNLCIYPVSLLSEKLLKSKYIVLDNLIGIVILFPAGFIFSDKLIGLPPALQSWLFGPHVIAYMFAYILMLKASIQSIGYFVAKPSNTYDSEFVAYQYVCLGFPLMTMGLVLGSIWGSIAWGNWWNWDPKELFSLSTWLLYVIYLHIRPICRKKTPLLNHIFILFGIVLIILTLLWINLSKIFTGLHNYSS